ncbi:MAG: NlpC/P60 family protein [Sulfurovum sp.]|nr:NlpC/P60 family protein [Sulfurovum sp.]
MKRLYKLLLPISIATVTSHAAATKTVTHKIKSGESLYTIAKKNHTTVATLCKINGIKKSEVLKVGRAIKIPGNTAASSVKSKKKVAKKTTVKKKHIAKRTTKSKKYVIKSGDTLSTLAKKHHTTVAALQKVNHLKKSDVLKLGQTLTIPGTAIAKKTKKVRVAKHTSKKAEKKLAKALKRVNTQKFAKKSVRKSRKFTLSDIVFGRGNKLSSKSKKIISLAKQNLGKRYVWGATGQRNTFDCSGFTTYVCKKNGICLPRRAIQQSKYGKPVKRSELQPGDLVFFDTSKTRRGYVNHVGIYIGNGKFIHASSAKKKVVITSLNKPFYSQRFKGARRVASL